MFDKIQQNIANSYLLGCIKYKSKYSFYLMPIAYWILNHLKYDPEYKPNNWEFVFRDNILNVDENNVEPFFHAIQEDKIDLLSINFNEYSLNDIFLFFIDFDSRTFINYFDDISIEDYLPDEKWDGKFDNPINYLPNDLKHLFL